MARCIWLVVALGLFVLPASVFAQTRVITGLLHYRERITLPSNAIAVVDLEDVSLPDIGPKFVKESRFRAGGSRAPIAFRLQFSAQQVDPSRAYQLRARIFIGNKVAFVSERAYAVRVDGTESPVQITMVPPPLEKEPPPLIKFWRVDELFGHAVNQRSSRPIGMQFEWRTGAFTGYGGVNGFSGTYTVDGYRVRMEVQAITRRAGPRDLMRIETQLVQALNTSTSAKTFGKRMVLYRDGTAIAKFTALETRGVRTDR